MSEEQENGQADSKDRDVFVEPKQKPTLIRVLTVMAYVLSVSMAAILLSAYYVFMWDGHPNLARRAPMAEPRIGFDARGHPNETYFSTSSTDSVDSTINDGVGGGETVASATQPVGGFGKPDVDNEDRSENDVGRTSPTLLKVLVGRYQQQISIGEKSNVTSYDENDVTNKRMSDGSTANANKTLETKQTTASKLMGEVKFPNQTPKYEDAVTPTVAQLNEDANESNTEMDNSSLDVAVAVANERNLLYKRYFYKNFLK